MKSLKTTLLICLLFGFSVSVKSQNLETVKVYYDYAKTRIKETYSVKRNSGIKQGIYKFYDQDRMLLLEIPYVNNMKNGIAKSYITAGSASLELKPMFYYGKLEHTMTYKDDELDGSYKTYNYDTGKQVLKFDRIWATSELIKDIEYYDNGIKKELKQKNGVCNMWYETGEKMFEYSNINNVNVGLHTEWFKNGKINVQGTYNDKGKEQGIWKQWDDNGILTETLYDNGVDVKKEKEKIDVQQKIDFDRNEQIKKEKEFKRQEKAKEIADQKIKDEMQQKNDLFENRIRNTNLKSQQVEKLYVIVDEIQTSVFGKEVYKTKKKYIYNAFTILRNDFSEKINYSNNIDEKLILSENLEKLLNLVIELREKETKDLEKELKNAVDIDLIKTIFKY